MKILFDHPSPFLLAHGGFQTQIEQTKNALEEIGVEVEHLRWWDARQRGDLIHFFSAPSQSYLNLARAVRLPVVNTTLFTETCNRSDAKLRRQGFLVRVILSLPFGEGIKQQLTWGAYKGCAHNVVTLAAEKFVLETVYGIAPSAISIVPYGLSEIFLRAGRGDRSKNYLISTGTITERKNCIELAEMAKAAKVPILFVGKPYHPDDAYWRKFERRIDGQWVQYHSHVESEEEMVGLLKASRGYVLFSRHENWCLSAHEAAACGLPLLVPDQKWSRERFGGLVSYFRGFDTNDNVQILKQFYDRCPSLPPPPVKFYQWKDAAQQLKTIYEAVLSVSR